MGWSHLQAWKPGSFVGVSRCFGSTEACGVSSQPDGSIVEHPSGLDTKAEEPQRFLRCQFFSPKVIEQPRHIGGSVVQRSNPIMSKHVGARRKFIQRKAPNGPSIIHGGIPARNLRLLRHEIPDTITHTLSEGRNAADIGQ